MSPRCGGEQLISTVEPDQDTLVYVYKTKNGNPRRISTHDCPFCGSKNGLSILGSRAASLASAAIGTLFASSYNDDRKLITFSDSVQDAAHRAGFFQTRTFRTTLRTALRQHLDSTGSNLADIRADFSQHWRNQIGSDADYIATFMPSDLEWLKEWEELQRTAKAPLNLIDLIDKRLDWEVVAEVGLRTSFGGSLERTASCAIYLNQDLVKNLVPKLLEILRNEIGGLEGLQPEALTQFLLGFIYHLRQRGGILHAATNSYIESGGKTFLLQKPLFMPGFAASLAPVYLIQNGKFNFPGLETVIKSSSQGSWCETWLYKLFASYTPLIIAQAENLYNIILNTLVKHHIFGVMPKASSSAYRQTDKGVKVWG